MAASSPPASSHDAARLGSEATTRLEGGGAVRVSVAPEYMPEHSQPLDRQYVFAYRIRISNETDGPVQVVRRHWIIVDANGERHEVRGEGVVGRQPMIDPGETFEYASYCPLRTSWGTMEGTYRMTDAGGRDFDAAVARFYLAVPQDADR